MPIDWITLEPTKKYGRRLERFVQLLREVRDLGEEIKGVFDHNAADPDYSGINAVTGCGPSNSQAVYNLLAGAYARVNHADVTSMIDRVG